MKSKSISTVYLKSAISLIALALLVTCVYWLPLTVIQDAKDHPDTAAFLFPFLIWAYGLCLTVSVALYHIFRLLTHIERNAAFSTSAFTSLQVIKRCTFAAIFFLLLGIGTLRVMAGRTGDDAAGPIALSLIAIIATTLISAVVDTLQKPLVHALNNKSEDGG
nr:DUF2975 domain-containing protein [Exiguobacterium flavidum]